MTGREQLFDCLGVLLDDLRKRTERMMRLEEAAFQAYDRSAYPERKEFLEKYERARMDCWRNRTAIVVLTDRWNELMDSVDAKKAGGRKHGRL